MEIQVLRRLIAEGRYEVDARLVAEAIVERLRPPATPPDGHVNPGRPGQLPFDSRVIPPPGRPR